MEHSDAALTGVPREANGGPPEGYIVRRANRSLVVQQISQVSDDPFQALTIQNKAVREFGGSKIPFNVSAVGGKEVNTAESTKAPIISEIGKGSIADIVL